MGNGYTLIDFRLLPSPFGVQETKMASSGNNNTNGSDDQNNSGTSSERLIALRQRARATTARDPSQLSEDEVGALEEDELEEARLQINGRVLNERRPLTFNENAVLAWIDEELRIHNLTNQLRDIQLEEDRRRALACIALLRAQVQARRERQRARRGESPQQD